MKIRISELFLTLSNQPPLVFEIYKGGFKNEDYTVGSFSGLLGAVVLEKHCKTKGSPNP